MKTYNNVFIGIVDILGYSNVEQKLKTHGAEASEALLAKIYEYLDQITKNLHSKTGISWLRYGDGYVFHSPDRNVESLSEMVKMACRLIAQALTRSIPLRVAITQNTINVDNPSNGLTITGSGWGVLRKIEKSLNWMGGLLYLPSYDGTHHETVQNLIKTTNLITEQTVVQDVTFTAPFINGVDLLKRNTWFINWYKILRQEKSQVDSSINNWWSQIAGTNGVNNYDVVIIKQKNSIEFADYCRSLNKASNLVFHSGINKTIDISKIMSSE